MRLIDADALWEKLNKIEQSGSGLREIGLEPLIAIKDVKTIINDFPNANEEIVLCQDCEDWDHGENESCSWSDCRIHHHFVNKNDYCSWAIKKEKKAFKDRRDRYIVKHHVSNQRR